MKLDINNYPGSKNATGLKQFIINRIPEYSIFYELFGGSGVITRELSNLIPKKQHVISEISPKVYRQLVESFNQKNNVEILHRNSMWYLDGQLQLHTSPYVSSRGFLYLDPPYIKTSRRSRRNLYEHEWEIQDHIDFLNYVSFRTDVNIMISCYDNDLYKKHLNSWYKDSIKVQTRKGSAIETVYMNYDIKNTMLASYEYLGNNFTDRQRIKRRKKSFLNKFQSMGYHERMAILQHIQNNL